jgi:hypothetical protein
MPTLSDPDDIDALLDALKAEKHRRLQERVDAGERPAVIVTGIPGASTEYSFDDGGPITIVITGVPRAGDPPSEDDKDYFEPHGPSSPVAPAAEQPSNGGNPSPSPASTTGAPLPGEAASEAAGSSVPPATYIWVTIMPPTDGDPGEIAEGLYTVGDNEVTVTDVSGKHIGTRFLEGEDPLRVARRILRSVAGERSRIHYPKLVVA